MLDKIMLLDTWVTREFSPQFKNRKLYNNIVGIFRLHM